jgi:hypothetical protein
VLILSHGVLVAWQLSDVRSAARRHEGLDALDVKVTSFERKITDQKAFADYGERRAYAELIVKLGGHFVPTNRIESPGRTVLAEDVRQR